MEDKSDSDAAVGGGPGRCSQCGSAHLPARCSRCVCGTARYCSTDCQRQHWKLHKPDCPPFTIRKSRCGLGMFATRKLKLGDVIVEENPLMVIDKKDKKITLSEFSVEFNKLDNGTRDKIFSLSESEKTVGEGGDDDDEEEDNVGKAWRIFAANSMQVCEVKDLWSPSEGGVYFNISRINHSCTPNAVWSWSQGDVRRRVVRCLTSVAKDEEIFCNYVDNEDFNFGVADYRGLVLRQKFGFTCCCHECSKNQSQLLESDAIREVIVKNQLDMDSAVRTYERDKVQAAFVLGMRTLGLIERARILLEIPRFILNLYQITLAARSMDFSVEAPEKLAEQSLKYCAKYGDSFLWFYNFVTQKNKNKALQ